MNKKIERPHNTFSCDLCRHGNGHRDKPALYDGKTKMGTWAYMCQRCFIDWGVGLGLGKGQKFIIEEPKK